MEREEALKKLIKLEGRDLRQLAEKNNITVWKNGRINKGWAGHAIERYLGLPINSSQSPNFGSWELKIVPLKYLRNHTLVVKETMAITMIDDVNVCQKKFKDSHLYAKLRKMIVCARIFESKAEESSILVRVRSFDLNNLALLKQIENDYEEVRRCIKENGFDYLSGRMGVFIQPRTKGAGHGTKSRAFYARKNLVSHIIGLPTKNNIV